MEMTSWVRFSGRKSPLARATGEIRAVGKLLQNDKKRLFPYVSRSGNLAEQQNYAKSILRLELRRIQHLSQNCFLNQNQEKSTGVPGTME